MFNLEKKTPLQGMRMHVDANKKSKIICVFVFNVIHFERW